MGGRRVRSNKGKKEVHMDLELVELDLEKDLEVFQIKLEKQEEKLEVIKEKRELHMVQEPERLVQEENLDNQEETVTMIGVYLFFQERLAKEITLILDKFHKKSKMNMLHGKLQVVLLRVTKLMKEIPKVLSQCQDHLHVNLWMKILVLENQHAICEEIKCVFHALKDYQKVWVVNQLQE